jgi:hypothetical protein
MAVRAQDSTRLSHREESKMAQSFSMGDHDALPIETLISRLEDRGTGESLRATEHIDNHLPAGSADNEPDDHLLDVHFDTQRLHLAVLVVSL